MCTANIHLHASSWLIDTGTLGLLVELLGVSFYSTFMSLRPVWADPAIFGTLQPWHFLCTQQATLAILSSAILSVRCSPKEMALYFQYHFSFVFCWKTQVNIVLPRNVFGILHGCVDRHHIEEKNPIVYTSWRNLLPGLCLLHTATPVFFCRLRLFWSEPRSAGKIKVRFWTSVLKWKFNIRQYPV